MSRVLPILFNTDMVRAILDGRKTMTRRAVKFLENRNPAWTGYIKDGLMLYNGSNEPCCKKPPCHVGDILYVRETWAFQCCIDCMNIYEDESCMIGKTSTIHEDKDAISEGCYIYRADHPHPEKVIWCPSIHMQRDAARIWLKVTDVRVERLQEITIDEVIKEGCADLWVDEAKSMKLLDVAGNKSQFTDIWNSTIKKSDQDLYGWDANPWVWVIEFERCEKPEGN